MAPEVMFRKNHSFEVDFYAAGIILYEIVMGRRPYHGRDRSEMRAQIMAKQARIKRERVHGPWSNDCIDLCNALIQRKPSNRLGYEGALEIKRHPWFKDIDWHDLEKKRIKSPFSPKISDSIYHRVVSQNDSQHLFQQPGKTGSIITKKEIHSKYLQFAIKLTNLNLQRCLRDMNSIWARRKETRQARL